MKWAIYRNNSWKTNSTQTCRVWGTANAGGCSVKTNFAMYECGVFLIEKNKGLCSQGIFLFLELLCVLFPMEDTKYQLLLQRQSQVEMLLQLRHRPSIDSKLFPATQQHQRKRKCGASSSVYADPSLYSCCKGLSCPSLLAPPLSSPAETAFGFVYLYWFLSS